VNQLLKRIDWRPYSWEFTYNDHPPLFTFGALPDIKTRQPFNSLLRCFFWPTDSIFQCIASQIAVQHRPSPTQGALPSTLIKRVERTMWTKVFALGHMQINHCSSNFRMPQQFFKGNNIKPFFKQVGGVTVPERVQVHLFSDGGFLEILPHDPRQATNTIFLARLLTVSFHFK
jgi:hypothetical protein